MEELELKLKFFELKLQLSHIIVFIVIIYDVLCKQNRSAKENLSMIILFYLKWSKYFQLIIKKGDIYSIKHKIADIYL